MLAIPSSLRRLRGPAALAVGCALLGVAGWLWLRPKGEARPALADAGLEQIDPQNPCPIVCVAVATRVLGRPADAREIRQRVSCDPLGRASMAALLDGLKALDFSARGVRLSGADLRRFEGLPVILFVRGNHFLVALPVGDKSVVLFDPPHRPRRSAISELDAEWDGRAVVLHYDHDELGRRLRLIGLPDSAP